MKNIALIVVLFILTVSCTFRDPNEIIMQDGRWEGTNVQFNIFDNKITPDGSTLYYGYCMLITLVLTNTNQIYNYTFGYGGESFHVVYITDNHFSVDVYGCKVTGTVISPTSMIGTAHYVNEDSYYGHEEGYIDWSANLIQAR